MQNDEDEAEQGSASKIKRREKAPDPGLYPGVPIEKYVTWNAPSGGVLATALRVSPLHARAQQDAIVTPTETMILGNAIHTALLEPSAFPERYIVRPSELSGKAWHGGRTECKQWMEAAQATGKEILSESQHDTIRRAVDAVLTTPRGALAREWLEVLDTTEVSAVGDLPTGDGDDCVRVKARPDGILTSFGAQVQLKTVVTTDREWLSRDLYLSAKAFKAIVHREVLRAATGKEWPHYVFICVERCEPFDVLVFLMDPSTTYVSEMELKVALSAWSRCVHSGRWPGVGDERAIALGIPGWAHHSIWERLEKEGVYE